MEVPKLTGDKLLALASARKFSPNQILAMRSHIIVDHQLAPGVPEFTDQCLAHQHAIELNNQYVSALVARYLSSPEVI